MKASGIHQVERFASCQVSGNVIAGNDVGLSFQSSVSRVVFQGNVFAGNRVQAELLGPVNRAIRVATLISEDLDKPFIEVSRQSPQLVQLP